MYIALRRLTLCIIKDRIFSLFLFFFPPHSPPLLLLQTYIDSKGLLMQNTPSEWLRALRSTPPGDLADV